MCTREGYTDRIRRGKREGKLRWLWWGLFSTNPIIRTEGNKGTASRLQKKSHCQKHYHRDFFCMSIYKHSNGLDFTIKFRCNRKKQDKRLISHNFPLHLPQQTKHHSDETRYAASKWYSINWKWFFRIHIIGGVGGGVNKDLGGAESTLAGIRKRFTKILNLPWQGFRKIFTKIEAHAGMAEWLVRDLVI